MPAGTSTGRAKKFAVAIKPATQEGTDLQERIAHRAYQLYENRGDGLGSANEDWFRAEREILGEHKVSDTD